MRFFLFKKLKLAFSYVKFIFIPIPNDLLANDAKGEDRAIVVIISTR